MSRPLYQHSTNFRTRPLQSTAVAQAIAHRYVAALDGLGRLSTCAVQPRPDVLGARASGRHGLHVRLVIVGDDLLGDDLSTLEGLAEEGDGAGRVPMVAQQHVDDLTVLVDRSIQIPLLALAKQEHLIDKPVPADPTMASHLGRKQWAEHLRPHQDGPV